MSPIYSSFGVSDCAGGSGATNAGVVGPATLADDSSWVSGMLVVTLSLVSRVDPAVVVTSLSTADVVLCTVVDKSGLMLMFPPAGCAQVTQSYPLCDPVHGSAT